MADKKENFVENDSDTPTVTVEEIEVAQNATDDFDKVDNVMKGLDANRYATKKTVAQGMLDIALLTSNASQLKYVLQVGPKHEFYTLLVVLISISIVLQVVSAMVAVVLGAIFNINRLPDCRRAEILNDASLLFKIISISVNIVISVLSSIEMDSFSIVRL